MRKDYFSVKKRAPSLCSDITCNSRLRGLRFQICGMHPCTDCYNIQSIQYVICATLCRKMHQLNVTCAWYTKFLRIVYTLETPYLLTWNSYKVMPPSSFALKLIVMERVSKKRNIVTLWWMWAEGKMGILVVWAVFSCIPDYPTSIRQIK